MKRTFIVKLVNILLCLLLLGFYIKASAQDKIQMNKRQMIEKKIIDRRLDSLINSTVKELKISNDTIRAKNEMWRKIDRSMQQRSRK